MNIFRYLGYHSTRIHEDLLSKWTNANNRAITLVFNCRVAAMAILLGGSLILQTAMFHAFGLGLGAYLVYRTAIKGPTLITDEPQPIIFSGNLVYLLTSISALMRFTNLHQPTEYYANAGVSFLFWALIAASLKFREIATEWYHQGPPSKESQ